MEDLFLELSSSGGSQYRHCRRESLPALLDAAACQPPPGGRRTRSGTVLRIAQSASSRWDQCVKPSRAPGGRTDQPYQSMDGENAAVGHRHDVGYSWFWRLPDHAPAMRTSTQRFHWACGQRPFESDGEWQLSSTLVSAGRFAVLH